MGSYNRGRGKGIAFLRAHVGYAEDACLDWPLSCDNHGYAIIGVDGKRLKAARVMCELVNGPAPSPQHHAAHSCGRGQNGCVHPRHVRWATPKENMADSVRLGAVRQRGARPFHKLTEADVAQILALRGQKSYREIGSMFGVRGKQIGKILRGEQWVGGKRAFGGFKPGDPRNKGGRFGSDRAA